jgi:raffinose/stachyose/melibiose transport system permease protein
MRRRRSLGSLTALAILVAAALFMAFPVYMALLNSFKTEGAMLRDALAFPAAFDLGNYAESIRLTRFPLRALNTLTVALIGVGGILAFGSLAGYKLARTPGKLSALLFGVFVSSMLIPFHSIMIPLTKLAARLRLQGSLSGLGVIYVGLGVPMAIFLFHGFTKTIPREIEEAAVIDGCGELGVFARISLPMMQPVAVSVIVLNALWIWNDYLLPLLMLTDPDKHTLVVSVSMFFGQYTNEWSLILATLSLALLPAFAIYVAAQKQIVSGIADGALKG